jgi:hypothetical protein
MSESLGEEPKKNLAEQEKQKPSLLLHNFHNLNINKALKSTRQITVIIPSGTIFISRKRYRYISGIRPPFFAFASRARFAAA